MYTPLRSARWIGALPEPLFGYPLMADGAVVGISIASHPCSHQHHNSATDADGEKSPAGVHERCSAAVVAIAGASAHRGTTIGGTRLITASNNALGPGDVAATMSATRVSGIALAAI